MIGDWKQHVLHAIWSIVVGGILGWASGSYLVGGGLSAVSRKIAFGDMDAGFAWTRKDILFWTIAFIEGVVGAAVGAYFRIRERAMDVVTTSYRELIPPEVGQS